MQIEAWVALNAYFLAILFAVEIDESAKEALITAQKRTILTQSAIVLLIIGETLIQLSFVA